MLAATSFGSGSRPTRHTAILWPGFSTWAPTGGSPVAALGSMVALVVLLTAWWQLRAARVSVRWWWVTAALWFTPLLASVPLLSRDVYSYAAQGLLWQHGLSPYEHSVGELESPWREATAPTWLQTFTPYGPLWLGVARGAAVLAQGQLGVAVLVLRLVAVAALIVIAWAVADLAKRLGSNAVRATWLAVANPFVGVHVVSGAHNDVLMVAGVVAAVALAARGRQWWPFVLLAAAALVKMTALVALPFVVLLLADRRWPAIVRRGVLGAATTAALVVAASTGTGLGFGWLRALDAAGQNESWLSLPTALGYLAGVPGHLLGDEGARAGATAAARSVGLVVLVLALAWLWLRAAHASAHQLAHAPAREPIHQPAYAPAQPAWVVMHLGWALAAVVLLAPSVMPWYILWALPILAVTGPAGWWGSDGRERARATWLGGITAVLALLTLPDGYTVALRLTAVGVPLTLAVAVLAVRAVWRVLSRTHWRSLFDLGAPLDSPARPATAPQ